MGNALAEAEAAKAVDFGETIAYDVNLDALKGVGIVMNTDGSQAVDSSDTAKITRPCSGKHRGAEGPSISGYTSKIRRTIPSVMVFRLTTTRSMSAFL